MTPRIYLRFVIPVACQLAVSLSNFAVALLLIRYAAPGEYAIYVLGFSTALYFAGIQDSLISTPVTVRAGSLYGTARLSFVDWHGRAAAGFWLMVAVIVAMTASVIPWGNADHLRHLVPAIATASTGWIIWDYQRVRAFALDRFGGLAAVDATYLAFLSAGIGWLWATDRLSGAMTLVTIGAAGVAAGVMNGSRPSVLPGKDFRRAIVWWLGRGKLSLAGAQVTWLQSQSYIYLVTALLGLQALAAVAATRLLFAPVTTAFSAWVKVFLPRLSREADPRSAARTLFLWSILILTALLIWSGVILLASDWLGNSLFRGNYGDTQGLIICWVVALGVTLWRSVWQTGVRARNAFAPLLRIAIVGAFVAVIAIATGAIVYGSRGAVLGLALAEAVAGSLCVRAFLQARPKR